MLGHLGTHLLSLTRLPARSSTRPPASPRDRGKPARSMNPSRHARAGGRPSAAAIQALALCPPCANTPTSLVCRANNRSRRVRGHERITGSLPRGRLWCPHTTSSIRCCPSWPITALPVCVLAHALARPHTLAHPLAHAPACSHSTCTPVRHTRPLACSPAVSLPPALTVSQFADHPSHTHAYSRHSMLIWDQHHLEYIRLLHYGIYLYPSTRKCVHSLMRFAAYHETVGQTTSKKYCDQ
ncbi:uncharacterized protein B0H18DRAFT_356784 [Fomitopsis serialis]|uniref:uncharacterized protein n=1 Tax=Fomitopsis serialis TaxID=139415 RepID=UPI0020081264|nr:uncharacterized protein B0H18DRAFT_356784 [Neoantrodia serialis]KAH9911524.1 hypothetical protein B0H18DRAFT_356784 [Neoantrodia serialis]